MGYLDYYERVEGEVQRIEESEDLVEDDRKLLLKFKRDMKIKGNSDSYIHSLLVYCRKMAERSDEGIGNATRRG